MGNNKKNIQVNVESCAYVVWLIVILLRKYIILHNKISYYACLCIIDVSSDCERYIYAYLIIELLTFVVLSLWKALIIKNERIVYTWKEIAEVWRQRKAVDIHRWKAFRKTTSVRKEKIDLMHESTEVSERILKNKCKNLG